MSMSLLVSLHAVEVTWDGEGNDKEWFNPINWDGDIVPTALDDVVIPSSFIVILDDDTAIQSLRLEGMLTIENSAVLGVFEATQDGVEIFRGTLVVDGALNVALAEGWGIDMQLSSLLIINGKVTINDVGTRGINISTNAELRVSGTLDIVGAESHGVVMNFMCSVEIMASGIVTIEDVLNGIEVSNTFINHGTVLISQPKTSFSSTYGIKNSQHGVFENRPSGSIQIIGEFSLGIDNDGEVLNSGTITIENVFFRGLISRSFVNIGVLSIHSSSGLGAIILNSFENHVTGVVNISGMSQGAPCLLLNTGIMINSGQVALSNFEGNGFSILDDGSFLNFGEVLISGTVCQRIVFNQGAFLNDTDASIIIAVDNISQVIQNTGQMLNRGTIDSEGVLLEGFLMSRGANTFFENSGTLNIGALSMTSTILIQDSSSFVNSGNVVITVLFLTSTGIELSDSGSMTNTTNGDFLLDVMGTSSGDPMFIEAGSVFEGLGLFDIRMN